MSQQVTYSPYGNSACSVCSAEPVNEYGKYVCRTKTKEGSVIPVNMNLCERCLNKVEKYLKSRALDGVPSHLLYPLVIDLSMYRKLINSTK